MEIRTNLLIVRLDFEKMKKRIRESPKKVWNMLKEFIPRFQYEKLDALCEGLKVEFAKVSRKATTVD
jgi:hypothetical protein